MAFTYQNRRLAYDHIATGSATGQERCTGGALTTQLGETTRSTLGNSGNASTSALAIAQRENVVHDPTTNDWLVGMTRSQSSDIASTSGYTSGTSTVPVGSVFPERPGGA